MEQTSENRAQVTFKKQVRALMKKNMKIHMRTNACPCCPCCNDCCGFGYPVISGCCSHFFFPLFFVFVVTAVPWFVIQLTMDESDRKDFLEVKTNKPRFPKPYPSWDANFYDLSFDAFVNLHGLDAGFTVNRNNSRWNLNAPLGVRPVLDSIFLPSEQKRGTDRGPDQYSCWCKTLAIVGPSSTVNEFKTFLDSKYQTWLAGRNQTDKKLLQLQQEIKLAATIINPTSPAPKARRVARSSVEEPQLPTSPPEDAFHELFDFAEPWIGHDTKSRLKEALKALSSVVTPPGRRLQRGRGGDGPDERAVSWAACDVNDGAYQGPIWRHFGSAQEVDDYILEDWYGDYEKDRTTSSAKDRLCGAVTFNNDVRTAAVPDYTIRMNVSGQNALAYFQAVDGDLTLQHTQPNIFAGGWRKSFHWYWDSGFLAVQHLMHHFLYETHSPTGAKELLENEPHFNFLPMGESTTWMFGDIVGGILGIPFTMTLQFGPLVATLAYYVARERQTRQRELMRMMGLSDGALMWSWLFLFAALNLVLSMVMMIMFKIFLFKYSDWFLWWIILFFFSCGVSVFGMAMAAFVSTDKWAALTALGLFFGLSWLSISVGTYADTAVRFLVGLVPSNAFFFTASCFWTLETWMVGATFDSAPTDVYNYSVSLGTFQLFFNFWFWVFVYFYFDQIIPWHGVGVARKPWFCCQPAYWREFFGKPALVGEATAVVGENATTKPEFIEKEDDPHLLQLVQNNRTVVVKNLTKHFSNAAGQQIKAVDGLSFKMYENECFCLLGHNGAGKTTTMMMLTGCMTQSSGSIDVKGFKIPEQIRTVRSSMGFCPQHNVLFDELTVFEHLELFGCLGGMDMRAIEARGDQLLSAVALLDKKHARATALSGGMKRKLSAALAFLAEPYMVILDEPSSGMDPFARRGMWDTLKRWRSGHIVCLTTHYMDEADALGDRIAIMSNGRLACSGTPNFLKKTFGCGYVIAFAKSEAGHDKDNAIVQAVKAVVGPSAEIMSAVGKELLVQVQFASAVHFPVLFQAIDAQKNELGVESYGTSVTNLEEVFLKVAHHGKADQNHGSGAQADSADAGKILVDSEGKPRAQATFVNQVGALLIRRIKFGFRDRISCGFELVLPTFCLFLAIALMSLAVVSQLPNLDLDTSHWNTQVSSSPKVPISLGMMPGNPYSSMAQEVVKIWSSRDGMDIIADPALNISDAGLPPIMRDAIPVLSGTTLLGNMEENSMYKYAFPQPSSVASQYGAIFYPKSSSWCPATQPGVTVFANLTASHSLPVLFNAHGEVALAKATQGATTPISKIKVSNHPLGKTSFERGQAVVVSGIMASVMIMAAYGFIPATVSFYAVMEKEKDVKNQLIISGCGQLAYWTSNFIYDTLWGVLPAASAMIIFAAYNTTAFVEEPGLSASIALFMMFLPAMTGFAYLFSFLFNKAGNALIFSWLFNLAVGFLGVILMSVLLNIEQTYDVGMLLRWLLRFVPTFSLGYGFLLTSVQQARAKAKGVGALVGLAVGEKWCTPPEEVSGRYLDFRQCHYMVGDEFLIMTLSAIIYPLLVCLLDIVFGLPAVKSLLFRKAGNLPQLGQSLKDEMVLAEEERVQSLTPSDQYVYVNDLHKVYPNGTYAVRGISFAASEGQVFGLLGVNGAGKTSTFKILCGQVEQTKGQVLIQGIDVATRAPEARKLIGYCPQFDALLEPLTVQEHLFLYGRIKGLTGAELADTVQAQLRDLDLLQYVHSRAGRLSGGNKRKLSVAMATIGQPPMVFLDEPSAGMDPVARRGMWSLIQNIAEKRKKSVVILTTHSMEEAEALCSRIAIQVDGQFRCLGTAQQIKSKYGRGLELNVRLATPSMQDIQECAEKLASDLPATGASTSSTLIDVATAAKQVTSLHGERVTADLAARHGSPLADNSPVTLGVLAEWVLLQARTSEFENFLTKEMGPETGGVPCFNILEKTQNVVRYQIAPEALTGRFSSLGSLFQLFQDNQKRLLIEDFQVCQASLEQIFNKFAATQMAQATAHLHFQQSQQLVQASVQEAGSTAQQQPAAAEIGKPTEVVQVLPAGQGIEKE